MHYYKVKEYKQTLMLNIYCDTLSANNLSNTLLHEYRDLFIDMAVRNNRSKLAIANRHQER